jgi:serine/threonine protein kinase/Tfp pilus assembly protein PilF
MPKINELEIARRAVLEGTLPAATLEACLADKRRARADGLDLTLKELIQAKGYFAAGAWEALEKRAATAETKGDGPPPDPAPPPQKRTDPERRAASESGPLVLSAELLGDYRIIKELGRGAMGVVYEAIQGTLGRRVALKVLPAGAAMSGISRERFLREARAAASLAHPGIVPIYDQGEERGVPYFAMELVRGRTLKAVLADEGPLEPTRAARLAAQAARALEYAHERGVIHRDVKPDNLFLVEEDEDERGERVLLGDFGLATRLDDAALTREGTVVGTPLYMSPEQAKGERDKIDRRVDVYSLGATLYELVSGEPPFDGSADTQVLLTRIRDEDAVSLRRRVKKKKRASLGAATGGEHQSLKIPDVAPSLDAVVARCLEKDPERRYATAGALADDLERFLRGEPVLAKPPSAVERADRYVRRRARPIALLSALLVFLILALLLGAPIQRHVRANALVLKALDVERAGSRAEARGLLEQALVLVPNLAAARAHLAAMQMADGDLVLARAALDAAILDEPENPEARILRGELSRRQGELARALDDFDVATRVAAAHDPRASYGRGAVLAGLGRWGEAAAELAHGLDVVRDARGRPSDDRGFLDALVLSGEARFRTADLVGAQQDLEEAIRLDPFRAAPHVLLGKVMIAAGKDAPADAAFEAALRRSPDDPEALELRAGARRRLGRAAEALYDLAAAGQDRPRVRLLRGLVSGETLELPDQRVDFDYARSQADLAAALGLEGAEPTKGSLLEPADRARALVALAWIELASPTAPGASTAGAAAARVVKALERADAAVAITPDDPAIRLTRGLIFLRSSQPGRARADLEVVLASPSAAGLAYAATCGLAKLASMEGKGLEALELATKAVDLDPTRPAAHALRARLELERGDTARAREDRAASGGEAGAEARPEKGRSRPPIFDVADPFEAAERAASRGFEAFEIAQKDRNFAPFMQRATAWLRRSLVLDPDRPLVAGKLAFALYLAGPPRDAWNAYGQAFALDPLLMETQLMRGVIERDFKLPGSSKAGIATLTHALEVALRPAPDGDPALALRARFELARAYVEIGDDDKALENLDVLCALTPARHAALSLRARLLSRRKAPAALEARRSAELALSRKPEPADVARAALYLRAGEMRLGDKDPGTAVLFCTRAIEADPSNAHAWRRRGDAEFKGAPLDFPQAFLDLTTAIQLDPTLTVSFHKDVEQHLYRYRRFMEELNDPVFAVVESAPDLAAAHFLGGFWNMFKNENAAGSEAEFDEAIGLAPGWFVPYTYRAVVRMRQKNFDGAAADLAHAKELFAPDGAIPFYEGVLALLRGDKERCYELLETASGMGFRYPPIFKNMPELQPLQGEPRFDRLIDELGPDDQPWLHNPPKKR